ncbi:type IV pilin [Photobacterium carnosum]|uniref:type IV pilin n=1 Tax=Photobacterium carnosum TaxID=2023717 RepID=UPI001C9047BE|nr:type IV pilin [Photobacterium carnosum]MBY3788217.1 type IV pilin [Photobacterium carnosum]MCD9533383.1 type IV pilin [Photobacterium carnosum]
MTFNIKTTKGFGLLEVVIALGVLSVGVLGLVKMQAYMEVKAENALKTLDALHIAEAQMEYYQTRASHVSGAVSTASNLIPFSDLNNDDYCLTTNAVDKGFVLYCNVSPVSGGLTALSKALNTIDIKVSWADRRGVPQAVSLKTAISKYSEFD